MNLDAFVWAKFRVVLRGRNIAKLIVGKVRNFLEEEEGCCRHLYIVLSLPWRFKGKLDDTLHFGIVLTSSDSGLNIGEYMNIDIHWKGEGVSLRDIFSWNGTDRS